MIGPEWDQVLRALVFDAFDKRGTDEFDAALEAIVDAYYMWPLAEAEMYLDRAREIADKAAEAEKFAEERWYELVFESIDARRSGRGLQVMTVAA